MVILTNCLTEKADEGCLKVASSLTKRIKAQCPETMVLTYGRETDESDQHLRLNKLFLNGKLFSILRKKQEPVLYIPFSSNTRASIFRTWMLSLFSKSEVNVLFALYYPMDLVSRKLLKWSGAGILALSKESFSSYYSVVGNRAVYLKTGIDILRFKPIDTAARMKIRERYGIAGEKKVLLHVGHLKEGRNISHLLNVGDNFHVVLVVSTLTKNEQDSQLRAKLEARPNTTILDKYLPNIEEIYQMADVYFFPVEEQGNCIDVPLSVLEAASCNVPVVATKYGELKEFAGKEGFWFIDSFEPEVLNDLLDQAVESSHDVRSAVLEYDWDNATSVLEALDGELVV